MTGWIGEGLFDVNIAGEIFAAPGPDLMLEGIRAADNGGGVLICVSHHAGDLLNAELALELCEAEGIDNVDMVLLYDDISSAPKGREPERRGTAGLFFVWKLLGAFCEGDGDLAAAKALAEKVRDNTRSLAMSLSSCASPVTGEVMFEMAPDEMEIGMGLHGEVGMGRQKALGADETIDLMLPPLLEDLPFQAGDEVLVLLNNSGSLDADGVIHSLPARRRQAGGSRNQRLQVLDRPLRHHPGDGRLRAVALPRGRADESALGCPGQRRLHEAAMSAMGAEELGALIGAMAQRVAAERDALNRLDAALGDGDHGTSISTAFAVAVEDIEALEYASLSAIWLATAKALMNRMGGASGAIFGTFFLKGVASLRDVDRLSNNLMAELLSAGLNGVKARGKAAVGDKTMVDALEPAVAAFEAADDFGAAWAAAAAVARSGAESTRELIARQGRAKFLGERAIGQQDPGATTIALMFEAAHDWWKENRT